MAVDWVEGIIWVVELLEDSSVGDQTGVYAVELRHVDGGTGAGRPSMYKADVRQHEALHCSGWDAQSPIVAVPKRKARVRILAKPCQKPHLEAAPLTRLLLHYSLLTRQNHLQALKELM